MLGQDHRDLAAEARRVEQERVDGEIRRRREREGREQRLREHREEEAVRRAVAEADERQRQEDRRRAADETRLRHAAEDEERIRRRAFEAARHAERIAEHRVRSDPSYRPELLCARAATVEAEARWLEADQERRRWRSSWPW